MYILNVCVTIVISDIFHSVNVYFFFPGNLFLIAPVDFHTLNVSLWGRGVEKHGAFGSDLSAVKNQGMGRKSAHLSYRSTPHQTKSLSALKKYHNNDYRDVTVQPIG